jgi:outer membrane protein OmpA-like peptidoglycan-associated protein
LKHKLIPYLVLLLALPTLMLGYPGIGGGRGLLRVQNALVEDEAGLTVALHALGRNAFFFPAGELGDKKGLVADLVAPELSYAPVATKYVGLELFGSWGGIFQLPKTSSQDGFTMGPHDLKAGAKLSIPIIPVLKIGGTGSYSFIKRDTVGRQWLDPSALPYPVKALSWRALATLQFQDVLPSAPNLLFNYGKTNDETDYGAGVQIAGKGFALFVEAFSQQPDATTTGILDTDHGHIHLTPGVSLGAATRTSFTAAYTFSFGGDRTNASEVILGLSIPTGFGTRTPPSYGTIMGTIVDYRSAAPLSASLSLPDTKIKKYKNKPVEVGDNGAFKLEKMPVGSYIIEVSKDAYQKLTATAVVEKDKTTVQEFKLRTLKQYGTITGRVTDVKTGDPLAATVSFPGTSLSDITTDPATGVFTVKDVEVGVVPVLVSADGYQNGSASVNVKDGEVTTQDFELKPLKAFGTITGRVLDATSKAPVEATIAFPEAEALPTAAADVQTGVFTAEKIPIGTIAITASASGYLAETRPVVVEDGKVTNVEFLLRPAMEFGSVSGTVTDVSSGKPVKAEISFADPNLPRVMTDEATGFYKADKIPVGVNVVKASADGYFAAQATVTIDANKATVQNFTLGVAVQNGELTGMVKDKSTKNPLQATVYFPNSQVASVMSDSATGFFKAEVPVGATVVACSLPGYAKQLSQTPVIVKKGEPAVYNFEMLKIGTEIVLKASAIHFAFGSAEIRSEGYPALDEWVKLMKDNPFMTAEIQGHTDAVGSEASNQKLSERRAQAVVTYMTNQGIDGARLSAVGYGESRLLVDTQEANEENRRVVFKVTGEKQK